MAIKKCAASGCERDSHARGFCNPHYRRVVRYGTPRADVPITNFARNAAESFAKRTERRGDCLIWTGSVKPSGYGTLSVNGKTTPAHRYAWEVANGPIPKGMEIDHICHELLCTEPRHLRLATRSQNARNRSGANSRNALGVRNVRKQYNRYYVSIGAKGALWTSGHDTLEDAISVAEAKRAELFGVFAGNG